MEAIAVRRGGMKEKGVSPAIIAVVAVVVVVAVIVVGFSILSQRSSPSESTPPQEHTSNIVNGTISVSARNYQAYPFTIPSGATNAYVTGNFTASGGTGNDIEVLIMDATAFINWKNGHQVSVYYDSGDLTTSNFDVSLPAGGSYYLVYSNTFALLFGKNVQTRADLIYTM